jgi:hypothetical protein
MPFYSRPAKERFDEKWVLCNHTGCWAWTAGKDKDGYGEFWAGKELGKEHDIGAHRASWLIHKGKISEDMQVLHTCDNPSCVNPEHLFLGTNAKNMKDKVSKGRQPKGADYNRSSLIDSDIPMIRKSAMTARELALIYGVTASTIDHIRTRRKWKHVP